MASKRKASASADETSTGAPGEPSEEAVVAFLRGHPDFFSRHMDLLAVLTVPHPSGTAVSLLERQTAVLRDHNRQLERKLSELIAVAHDNERRSRKLHRLAMELLRAETVDDVLRLTETVLRRELGAETLAFRLSEPLVAAVGPGLAQGIDEAGFKRFENLVQNRRPVCGRLRPDQIEYLFGDDAAGMASAAVVPMFDGDQCLGFVAMASSDAHQYSPTLGTLFLNHFGELLAEALRATRGRGGVAGAAVAVAAPAERGGKA